jgi:hypothetical protein
MLVRGISVGKQKRHEIAGPFDDAPKGSLE